MSMNMVEAKKLPMKAMVLKLEAWTRAGATMLLILAVMPFTLISQPTVVAEALLIITNFS